MRAALVALACGLVACGEPVREGPLAPTELQPSTLSLPIGRYVPVIDGPWTRVWVPDRGRYVNEPTLVRTPKGAWHVFANGADGGGGPWVERQLLHASAPSLFGPWTELPDALSASDPGSGDGVLHAPFVLADGAGYRLYYFDASRPEGEQLRLARSPNLSRWTRDPSALPGDRDAFVLRLPGGRDLLYTVGVRAREDGPHDTVEVYEGLDLEGFREVGPALYNPTPCPHSCWGWYESPYVVSVGGAFYLFTTFTSSVADDYERTVVFRSKDPTRFPQPPIATLQAHGAEVLTEGGRQYLSRGGWPSRIGDDRRGLSIAPLAWVPDSRP